MDRILHGTPKCKRRRKRTTAGRGFGEGSTRGWNHESSMTAIDKKRKNGKTRGQDGRATELIKVRGRAGKRKISELLLLCLQRGNSTRALGQTLYCLNFEMEKGTQERTAIIDGSHLPHVIKLHERIIERRVGATVKLTLDEQKHGYRRNKGVTDMTCGLRIVTEKVWVCNQSLDLITLIDLQKVFDFVPGKSYEGVQGKLRGHGWMRKAIKVLDDLCM